MSDANAVSDLERAEHLAYAEGAGVKRVSVYNDGVQVNAATAEGQTDIISAVQNITIPAPEGGATSDEQIKELQTLGEILDALRGLATARGIASDIRVTLLGGTTAVTGTLTGVTTVTTVTTVSTVTNLSQIGAFQANTVVPSNQNLLATMANVNNVI